VEVASQVYTIFAMPARQAASPRAMRRQTRISWRRWRLMGTAARIARERRRKSVMVYMMPPMRR